MDERVYPAEAVYAEQRAELGPHAVPPIVEDLKEEARRRGLWNLFLPAVSGLTVTDYAILAETTGRSVELAPEALNCSAPDTGNMETLHLFGSDVQKKEWLEPLLDGRIRSAFAMTEPAVASSDATNIETTIRDDGDEWVIDGHKWWITGALDPRLAVMIVMGVTDTEAPAHARQSLVLVPVDTSGVEIVRALPVFGYQDREGHAEIRFHSVRVPKSNLLGERGAGFAMAQARLGPGRIHHCMRAIGMAEGTRVDVRTGPLKGGVRPDPGGAGNRPVRDRRVADGDTAGPTSHPLHRLADRHSRGPPGPYRDRRHQGGRPPGCVPSH